MIILLRYYDKVVFTICEWWDRISFVVYLAACCTTWCDSSIYLNLDWSIETESGPTTENAAPIKSQQNLRPSLRYFKCLLRVSEDLASSPREQSRLGSKMIKERIRGSFCLGIYNFRWTRDRFWVGIIWLCVELGRHTVRKPMSGKLNIWGLDAPPLRNHTASVFLILPSFFCGYPFEADMCYFRESIREFLDTPSWRTDPQLVFRRQKRILSDIWSWYTAPHVLRNSSRCKIHFSREWRDRPIPNSASEVTTPILHPTILLWQFISAIRQMFSLSEDFTCDAFHPEIRLDFPDLFEARSTLWGFCFLRELQEKYYQMFFNDFCDASDQLRDKVVRRFCVLRSAIWFGK